MGRISTSPEKFLVFNNTRESSTENGIGEGSWISSGFPSSKEEFYGWDWTNSEDSDEDEWNSLDLDWLSKSEVSSPVPSKSPTEDLFPTRVYEQSVSILIEMKTNLSESKLEEPIERALEVGPWRVSQDQIPFVLGSIVGGGLLLLMTVSLAAYFCLRKRHSSQEYNVKSETTSGSSEKSYHQSTTSASRDSLILVTNASLGHQARLLSENIGANTLLFDRSFDFYFNGPTSESTPNFNFYSKKLDLSDASADHTQECRSKQTTEQVPTQSHSENKVTQQEHFEAKAMDSSSPKQENDETDNSNDHQTPLKERTSQTYLFPKSPASNMKEKETNLSEAAYSENENLLDENLKFRSLPTWARAKSHSLHGNRETLASMYNKKDGHPPRRRNRMGSDAAQIIALSRSRVKLLGSSTLSTDYPCEGNSKGKNDMFDEAIIVFNERTAV